MGTTESVGGASVLPRQPAAAFLHGWDSRGLEAGVTFLGSHRDGFDREPCAKKTVDGGCIHRPRRPGDAGLVVGKGDEQEVTAGFEQSVQAVHIALAAGGIERHQRGPVEDHIHRTSEDFRAQIQSVTLQNAQARGAVAWERGSPRSSVFQGR